MNTKQHPFDTSSDGSEINDYNNKKNNNRNRNSRFKKDLGSDNK